jgi:ribosome biogenesis GTPase / thiamine phosphate phosphatase
MPALDKLGWRPFFQQQLNTHELADYYPARIAQIHRNHCVLWSDRGEQRLAIGVFPDPGDMAVGDWLLMPASGERPVRRLTRQTTLARKESGHGTAEQLIAANVDILFIVTSCDEDFNLARIERYLALASGAGVTPVMILTKSDLVDDVTPFATAARQLHPEVAIECVDARDAAQLARLRPWCSTGKTVALVGSSGVGKSTLINNLAAAQQATAAARAGDNKGRHTTTSRSLHHLKDGGLLVDTPGMREFQLAAGSQRIEDAFAEVSALLGRCKFYDCRHQGEAGCAIQAAIASGALDARRWRSYQTLRAEQRSVSPATAAMAGTARSTAPHPKPVRKGPRPPRQTDEDELE